MAEPSDKESRTEEASPRRFEEARKKGNTPFSREIGTVGPLLVVGFILPVVATYGAAQSLPALVKLFDGVADFKLENAHHAVALVWWITTIFALAIGPLMVALILSGIVASGFQNTPSLVWTRIKPDLSRLSPTKGLHRILGPQGRVEFLKAVFKTVAVVAVSYYAIKTGWQRVRGTLHTGAPDLPKFLMGEIADVFFVIGLCMAFVAAMDLFWARHKWRADLRMARHEVKEEHKQAEGDPMVRARQRSVSRNIARRRMMAAVPRATLVVANPTHFAIALRYVHGESAAPVVIAKGVDHIALKIREIAEQHAIPVVEDPMLARSLYGAISADRPIPPEFYRAIAEIILFIMAKQTKPAEAPPRVA